MIIIIPAIIGLGLIMMLISAVMTVITAVCDLADSSSSLRTVTTRNDTTGVIS